MRNFYFFKSKLLLPAFLLFAAGLVFGGNKIMKLSAPEADPCNWTVIVEDPFYFGDEVSWELRGSDGTVLLSGGGYEGDGYYDEQSVTAEGPLEFYISAVGTYNDNKPYYSVANENGVILSGVLHGGTEATFSDLNCDDPAEVEPDLSCAEQFVTTEEILQAFIMGGDINQRLAFDIPVGQSAFSVYGVNLNLFVIGDPDIYIDFTLFNDDNGKPGEVLGGAGGTVISSEYIGSAFGADLYKLTVQFSEPFDLNAETRYWLEVTAEADSWQSVAFDVLGKGVAVNADYTGSQWVVDPTTELVYELICSQMDTEDLTADDFDYYPNPAHDRLNIRSKKQIKSYEVYDLTGRMVMDGAGVDGNRIELDGLKPGTFVFKLVFEDGMTETFRLMKK